MTAKFLITGGGSVNWNSTGSWSLTDGGATGAAVPGTGDDVFMTALSGSGTLTLNTTSLVCNSINQTGFTGTFTGANPLAMGSATAGASSIALLLASAATYSVTGTLTFASTNATVQKITTAGKTLTNITFNGAGGSWQLQDGLTIGAANTITLTAGTFDTNGQTLTNIGQITSAGALTRVLTLGASAINMTGANFTVWNISGSGLTLNGGTSTITLTGNNPTFNGNGLATYNNVVINSAGIATINGTNTYVNFTRTGTAAITDTISFIVGFTVTGTLTLNGNSTKNRLLVSTSQIGVPITVTAAAIAGSYVDIKDIILSGAASPANLAAITGGSGDCGGNANITFTAAATQTLTGTTLASQNWSTAPWSGRIPLPQDPVKVTASWASGASLTMDMARGGASLDFTGTTWTGTALTWVKSVAFSMFGSLTMIPGLLNSGSVVVITFEWRQKNNTIITGGTPLSNSQIWPLDAGILTQIRSGSQGFLQGNAA